jgi:hypothetical protein
MLFTMFLNLFTANVDFVNMILIFFLFRVNNSVFRVNQTKFQSYNFFTCFRKFNSNM